MTCFSGGRRAVCDGGEWRVTYVLTSHSFR
nr:MAG TPA: hypothetical protein [Caudoviricetes sp.]